MVLMLNPRVGLMLVMSSPLSLLTMVVLPALSKPLQSNTWVGSKQSGLEQLPECLAYTISSRISFSFRLTLLMMVNSPMIGAPWQESRLALSHYMIYQLGASMDTLPDLLAETK
jgi:hypothetical protein